MQEYLDPIVYLLVLTFMNEKFELSKNFTYFITAYYGANMQKGGNV